MSPAYPLVMAGHPFIPLEFDEVSSEEMLTRSQVIYQEAAKRRTTRHFSNRPVDRKIIENAILAGGTAPNGAHVQPWTWVAISSQELKEKIRDAAEAEEKKTYEERMTEAWQEVLAPLGTDDVKTHLTDAPWIVVLFRQTKRERANGEIGPTYYSIESCGIGAGMFISAIHRIGLTTLTHTPSPMGFLRDILERPKHEVPMLVMPVGYPAQDAMVPDIHRKKLNEIAIFLE